MPYNNGIPVLASNLDFAMPGLQQLGGAIAHMVNPNREAQIELKKKLQEDPLFRQKLIDMEAQNPGTINRMFGKQADFLGEGTPSFEAQASMYAQKNANKPVEQWDESAASQAAQKKANLGTTLERAETKQRMDYYDLQQKGEKLKQELDAEQLPLKKLQIQQQIKDINNYQALIKREGGKDTVIKKFFTAYRAGESAPKGYSDEDTDAFFANEGTSKAFSAMMSVAQDDFRERMANAREARQYAQAIDIFNRQIAVDDLKNMSDQGIMNVNRNKYYDLVKDPQLDANVRLYLADPEAFAKVNPAEAQKIAGDPDLQNAFKARKQYETQAGQDAVARKIYAHKTLLDKYQGLISSKNVTERQQAEALVNGVNEYANSINNWAAARGMPPIAQTVGVTQKPGFMGTNIGRGKPQITSVQGGVELSDGAGVDSPVERAARDALTKGLDIVLKDVPPEKKAEVTKRYGELKKQRGK